MKNSIAIRMWALAFEIEGWHFQHSEKDAVSPDAESGFKAGYHLPDYLDIHQILGSVP